MGGPAVYFAEDFKYTTAYSFKCSPNSQQIIIASVLLGACFDYGTLNNPSLRQPPYNIHTKTRYNSISGITRQSRVYGIFNSSQSYPRYLVEYSIPDAVELPSSK